MGQSLDAAEAAFALGTSAGYAAAEEALEEVARIAKDTTTDFAGCEIKANYRGAFMSRALTAAFTVHDRFENPDNFMKYELPADFDLPLLDSE